MSHSPVPRIWTLHFFSHSTKTRRSRASHSQTILPESVSHKTRIFRTSVFSSSLNRFSSRATSWRVMQAIAWAETNLGIFFIAISRQPSARIAILLTADGFRWFPKAILLTVIPLVACNGCADKVAPFRPTAVVVADFFITE